MRKALLTIGLVMFAGGLVVGARPEGDSAKDAIGLAPEITDINARDMSYGREKSIPYLKKAFIDTSPRDLDDGVPVGRLGKDGGDKDAILKLAAQLAAGDCTIDSFLIAHKGKLVFESYYRRGRINVPHYQMSITKSYTSLAIGRAIQLGHLKYEDLKKPVVSFLKQLDRSKLALGAESVTLEEALNMRSGIRMSKEKARELMKRRDLLKGQGQIQAYLQHTAPITRESKTFKYQASDTSIVMQVLQAVVPGTAEEFIRTELLGKMGVSQYAWQKDTSGLPKSAAGSSMRSRDMIKWGLLVLNKGQWKGKRIIPEKYIDRLTHLPDGVKTGQSGHRFRYFWHTHNMRIGDKTYLCKSGRGAGGQFIIVLDDLRLVVVYTCHGKGMKWSLLGKHTPGTVAPGFIGK